MFLPYSHRLSFHLPVSFPVYLAGSLVYSLSPLRRMRMVISLIAQTDCENVQTRSHKDVPRCDDSGRVGGRRKRGGQAALGTGDYSGLIPGFKSKSRCGRRSICVSVIWTRRVQSRSMLPPVRVCLSARYRYYAERQERDASRNCGEEACEQLGGQRERRKKKQIQIFQNESAGGLVVKRNTGSVPV